jgi:hypothetical protein
MTDFEINIAIAEHCGWERHPMDQWIITDPKYPHSVQPLNTIPKYCEDLNAMHEAENALSQDELEIIYPKFLGIYREPNKAIRATARQRAEAFLKTVGKWEE